MKLSREGRCRQAPLQALGHIHGRGRGTVACVVIVVRHARDFEEELFAHDPQQSLQ
ncbi:MAG TPA: hypothetical protein VF257_00235 [Solirubrobacteraceae bacterium]